jgi:hypothetical protein
MGSVFPCYTASQKGWVIFHHLPIGQELCGGTMFKFIIDTCVWLDIAKDPELQPLLSVMDKLVQMQAMSLILPRTVIDEFQCNKERVVAESCRSLSSTFKRVREAVNKFGDPKKNRQSCSN